MKSNAKNALKFAIRKNRIKRHGWHILRDVTFACFLLGLSFFLYGLLVYGFSHVLATPYLSVKELEVRGLQELTEKEILKLAAVRPAQNILALNLKKSIRQIKTNPWVKEVSIAIVFPHRLVIKIKERKAVALLKKSDSFVLLDSDGVSFKKLEDEDKVDLPVLTGFLGAAQEIDSELFKKSLELSERFLDGMGMPTLGALSEVHISEIYGLTLFTDKGICLYLGFDDYQVKLKRLKVVWDDLEKKELVKGFMRIDLSDPDKVSVAWLDMSQPKEQVKSSQGLRT